MTGVPFSTVSVQNFSLAPLFKIGILLLILIYSIFTFFIYTKIKAIERIVTFPPKTASGSLITACLIYFILIILLFLLALIVL